MKLYSIRLLSVLSALILLGACAQMAGRASPDRLPAPDAFFMKEAAMGGVAEVSLGQLAMLNASNEEVKQFAHSMVNDQIVSDQQLRNLAEKKKVDLPARPDEQHQRAADRLARLKGSPFDRQYMSEIVKDHQKTVDLFKEQAAQGKDPEVRAFAERNLPILQQQLDHARALQGKVGG